MTSENSLAMIIPDKIPTDGAGADSCSKVHLTSIKPRGQQDGCWKLSTLCVLGVA